MSESCEWKKSSNDRHNFWHTKCLNVNYMPINHTPEDAGYKLCPYCGKPLVVKDA